MCLYNPKKVNTDNYITCYKRLTEIKEFDFSKVKSGDSFTALIKDVKVSGKISIFKDKYYFCTDHEELNGIECPNKFGYRYSWKLNEYVKDISVNGEPLPFELLYVTPYQNAFVKIGETYTSIINLYNDIIEAALHSFKKIQGAIDDLDSQYDVIAECIIPKGSECYLGEFSDKDDAYASDKLTYLRIIKPSSMTFEEFKSNFLVNKNLKKFKLN